ncbi:MAG TPA: host attachment protein [Stellaceae bacterium]|nr:host attachment protein [Stellaceae bacterium]
MKHPRTWYVVADGGRARILQKRDKQQAFDTLQEIVSADLHSATRDLGSERPGRTRESSGSARHAVQPRQDLHRAEKQNFVHELAGLLNAANTRAEFDALVLVAPAHALGDLRQALDAPTQRKVTAELQKDLTKVPNADLVEHFAEVKGGA